MLQKTALFDIGVIAAPVALSTAETTSVLSSPTFMVTVTLTLPAGARGMGSSNLPRRVLLSVQASSPSNTCSKAYLESTCSSVHDNLA